MDPGIGTNVRRRPSHTDLLSMAAAHDYSDLDFPRREYYGGSMWHVAGNWSGNSIPDANDDAFVRAAGPTNEPRAVAMNANAVALNLFVSEGGFVDVRSFVLSVGDNILLDGGSTMLVGAGGTAQTDVVTVQSNSNFTSNGGAVLTAIIRNSAQLAGHGTFSANVDFVNDGTINVSGGTMTLIGPALNLDGIATETGVINVLPPVERVPAVAERAVAVLRRRTRCRGADVAQPLAVHHGRAGELEVEAVVHPAAGAAADLCNPCGLRVDIREGCVIVPRPGGGSNIRSVPPAPVRFRYDVSLLESML